MEIQRFDALTRQLSQGGTRRRLLGLFGGTALGGLTAITFSPEGEAKRKKHKKKKKKCKSGTKKCGKKCIAATACCSSNECGNGGSCVNGACTCLSGFKGCQGECIPDDQCCGNSCPGDKVCDGGDCTCPEDAPFECPGDVCVVDGQCCDTADCPGIQECVEGLCACPGPDAINCRETCCDADTQICKVDAEFVATCQAGSCPATDYCIDPETYFCADNLEHACVCTTTVDPMAENACVDYQSLTDTIQSGDCLPCNSSADCVGDQVCIAGGEEFCGCGGANFCVAPCSEQILRSAKHDARSSLIEVGAKQSAERKRRRRR